MMLHLFILESSEQGKAGWGKCIFQKNIMILQKEYMYIFCTFARGIYRHFAFHSYNHRSWHRYFHVHVDFEESSFFWCLRFQFWEVELNTNPLKGNVDLSCCQIWIVTIITILKSYPEVSERKPLEDSCLPPLEGEVNLN